MDADTDYHCYERIMLFEMDAHHGIQLVVVQDAVVDPFGCRPVIIDFLPFVGFRWNRRVKPDVPFWLCVHGSAILGL